jgi:hypothetical protein
VYDDFSMDYFDCLHAMPCSGTREELRGSQLGGAPPTETGGRRDAAKRVATTRRATTGRRSDTTVSRRVVEGRCWRCRAVPPGCRVGGGDGDTVCRC